MVKTVLVEGRTYLSGDAHNVQSVTDHELVKKDLLGSVCGGAAGFVFSSIFHTPAVETATIGAHMVRLITSSLVKDRVLNLVPASERDYMFFGDLNKSWWKTIGWATGAALAIYAGGRLLNQAFPTEGQIPNIVDYAVYGILQAAIPGRIIFGFMKDRIADSYSYIAKSRYENASRKQREEDSRRVHEFCLSQHRYWMTALDEKRSDLGNLKGSILMIDTLLDNMRDLQVYGVSTQITQIKDGERQYRITILDASQGLTRIITINPQNETADYLDTYYKKSGSEVRTYTMPIYSVPTTLSHHYVGVIAKRMS